MKSADLRAALHGCLRPATGQCDCGREQWPHELAEECVRHEAELGNRGSMAVVAAHLPELVGLLEACETAASWQSFRVNGAIGSRERAAYQAVLDAIGAVHKVEP